MRGNLREIMLDSVGMVRCERGLREAGEFLDDNAAVLSTEYLDTAGMELKNMFILARLISLAAEMRLESRGSRMSGGESIAGTRTQRSRPPAELKIPTIQKA